jgi:transcriptional regulator with XRE-family HTH domain
MRNTRRNGRLSSGLRARATDGTGHRKLAGGMPAGGVPGPLGLFCTRLRRLQQAAGISQTSLARAVGLSTSQMSDILNAKIRRLPGWEVTDTLVGACLAYAQKAGRSLPPDLRDRADWRRRYGDAEYDLIILPRPAREAAAGWPLAEVTNPFDYDLEIHKPVELDVSQPGLPPLPLYVARDHDRELNTWSGRRRRAAVRSRCWWGDPRPGRRERAGRRWSCFGTCRSAGGCGTRSTLRGQRRRYAICSGSGRGLWCG